jgi:hypothetical protein
MVEDGLDHEGEPEARRSSSEVPVEAAGMALLSLVVLQR